MHSKIYTVLHFFYQVLSQAAKCNKTMDMCNAYLDGQCSMSLRVIKKGMRSTVEKIPGTINMEELQKIALMGTAHLLRKVLSTDL